MLNVKSYRTIGRKSFFRIVDIPISVDRERENHMRMKIKPQKFLKGILALLFAVVMILYLLILTSGTSIQIGNFHSPDSREDWEGRPGVPIMLSNPGSDTPSTIVFVDMGDLAAPAKKIVLPFIGPLVRDTEKESSGN